MHSVDTSIKTALRSHEGLYIFDTPIVLKCKKNDMNTNISYFQGILLFCSTTFEMVFVYKLIKCVLPLEILISIKRGTESHINIISGFLKKQLIFTSCVTKYWCIGLQRKLSFLQKFISVSQAMQKLMSFARTVVWGVFYCKQG